MKSLLHTLVVCGLLLMAACACAQPFPHVIWDRSGVGDSSLYGYKILPLGDQNDDGYADWAVWAAGTIYGGTQPGYVEFFHGGNPPSTTPYRTLRGVVGQYSLVFAEVVGDLNGDRYTDWLVAMRPASGTLTDQIQIHFGGPGADTLPDLEFSLAPNCPLWGMGDFNGDGFDDLFVFDAETRLPRVYYGGNPMDTIPDWPTGNHPIGSQALPWSFGDLNGDGYSDYVSADVSSNTTYIFLGGAHPDTVPAYTWPNFGVYGIVNSLNGDRFDDMLCYVASGVVGVSFGGPNLHTTADAQLSWACSGGPSDAIGVGDINRDGYNDVVLLRNYCANAGWGVLSLYLGHAWLNPQPVWTIEGRGWQNLVSIQTAAGLGDVNGDSIDDFAIGAWDDLDFDGWSGRCIIVAGDTMLRVDARDVPVAIPRTLEVAVYPNPFNSQATVSLDVTWGVRAVTLTTYNLLGQQVARQIMRGTPGTVRYAYDAHDLTSGVYLLRVQAGSFSTTQKLMILK